MAQIGKSVVVKEGWLNKKGEYVPNFRPRYFVLKSDGTFRGYKQPPKPGDGPINLFEVKGSKLSADDPKKGVKGGKYGFTVRFVQMTRVIERVFQNETIADRDEWVKAYQEIQRNLESSTKKQTAETNKLSPADDDNRNRAYSFVGGQGPTPCKIGLDDFEMLKVLGKGTFGKVMLAKHKGTGDIHAIKVLKKSMVLEKDELDHTLAENSVLAKCTHPFLTTLHYSFQTPDLLCFVMEYVNGGEIFYHLGKDKRFSIERTRFYIGEISLAITYLHDQNVIYRDLKLENLMLDRHGHIKITDFGLCKEEITFGATTSTFCGTPEYLAPEIIMDSDYGRAVDWWGVGVVMFEMITGSLPFRSKDYDKLFDMILSDEVVYPDWMDPHARDCISKLLVKDPAHRLGGGPGDGRDVQSHRFFEGMDWDKLYKRQIEPPFKPKIASETDTSNFDPYFTREEVQLTPPSDAFTDAEKDSKFAGFESVTKN